MGTIESTDGESGPRFNDIPATTRITDSGYGGLPGLQPHVQDVEKSSCEYLAVHRVLLRRVLGLLEVHLL
ncbi:hypothetical protein Dimus_022493 [Dionaea muscipula]